VTGDFHVFPNAFLARESDGRLFNVSIALNY
jgi:hypothetical protein